MICESCQIEFEGRPNRRYCSPKCRRKAEMKERVRKKRAKFDVWLASLSPEDRAFWGSIPGFSTEDVKDFAI